MKQIPIEDKSMLIDDEHMHLFADLKLRLQPSRNAIYAAFGKSGRAHRLILGVTDKFIVVDHINGNGLDNRTANLRAVSSATNVKNRRVSRSKISGMPPGMWQQKKKIVVQITENGKKIYVGSFDSQYAAHVALNKAREELGRPAV